MFQSVLSRTHNNQKYTVGWTEADSVPGWGRTRGLMREFLEEVG